MEHARRIAGDPVELRCQNEKQEDRPLLHQALEADRRLERLGLERCGFKSCHLGQKPLKSAGFRRLLSQFHTN